MHPGPPPPTTNHQSPPTHHPPPATHHQPPTTNHQPPTTHHPPPTTNHQPPATNHQPPTTNHQSADPIVSPQVLLAAWAADVAHAAAHGQVPMAANHFFTARELMERGELYPLLVRMPKGAALHVRAVSLRAWNRGHDVQRASPAPAVCNSVLAECPQPSHVERVSLSFPSAFFPNKKKGALGLDGPGRVAHRTSAWA